MELTQEQRDSVLNIDGNVLVIASAGSGKTSSFTTRIAYMISKGVKPENIMAVTFTKKATEEMKKRLNRLIKKKQVEDLSIGTFHGIALKILLKHKLTNGKIIQSWEKFSILSDICNVYDAERNHNGLNLSIPPVELASFISYQKSNMITVDNPFLEDQLILNTETIRTVSRTDLAKAYRKYEYLKNSKRVIDYDDILLILHDRLKSDEKLRSELSKQFKYVMIDEGQDTSTINMNIVKMINNKNVYIVGDFRQSIYSFMNANVENMLNFMNEFDDVQLIEMNKNFRSTQKIVDFSNRIIANSPIEKYKQFKPSESVNEVGDSVVYRMYSNNERQYDEIVREIENIHLTDGTPYSEFAVLVRTNAETSFLEGLFTDFDIPFEISKQSSFFERKEIIDLLSYARIAVDLDDDASLRRIINVPSRYIKKITIENLDNTAKSSKQTLINTIRNSTNLSTRERDKLGHLVDLILNMREHIEDYNAGRFIRDIMFKTKYLAHIEKTASSVTSLSEKKNAIENLCKMASKFNSVKAFTTYVSIIKDKQSKSKGKDTVKISTIHSSKGLEWDNVYVVSADEKNLPHEMSEDIEEERRLFYVACSRPRKHLVITSAILNDGDILQPTKFITENFKDIKAFKEQQKPVLRGTDNHVEIKLN